MDHARQGAMGVRAIQTSGSPAEPSKPTATSSSATRRANQSPGRSRRSTSLARSRHRTAGRPPGMGRQTSRRGTRGRPAAGLRQSQPSRPRRRVRCREPRSAENGRKTLRAKRPRCASRWGPVARQARADPRDCPREPRAPRSRGRIAGRRSAPQRPEKSATPLQGWDLVTVAPTARSQKGQVWAMPTGSGWQEWHCEPVASLEDWPGRAEASWAQPSTIGGTSNQGTWLMSVRCRR
jgi:hypothetical protein